MMELIARPGWERVLKQFEYKKSHVLLEKPLTNNIEEKQ
jgi:predicted dehydrogenase